MVSRPFLRCSSMDSFGFPSPVGGIPSLNAVRTGAEYHDAYRGRSPDFQITSPEPIIVNRAGSWVSTENDFIPFVLSSEICDQ